MIAGGFTRFNFECLELSPFLIERGNARIKERGLDRHLSFTETNLAHWRPERKFGAAFANQSLHHIEALEHVFDMIGKGLEPQGSFVAADMIGRNGHMRWPESLAIINALWTVIPDHWKQNRPLGRFEETSVNQDCSTVGFEGIRAQDILPLLLDRFQFHRFAAWGGLLDCFIGPCVRAQPQVTEPFRPEVRRCHVGNQPGTRQPWRPDADPDGRGDEEGEGSARQRGGARSGEVRAARLPFTPEHG